MKIIILVALGLLAVVSAKQGYFIDLVNITPVEKIGNGGKYIRNLNVLREHLGLPEEFSLQAESYRKASSGVRRVRLRQLFKGLPIRVATLQASQNENGFYTGAVSGFCPHIPVSFDTSQSKPKAELAETLVSYINNKDYDKPNITITLDDLQNFYSEKQIHIDTNNGNPVVVYYVSALVDITLRNGAYIRYPRVLFSAEDLKAILAILPVKKGHKKCQNAMKACPKAHGGNAKVCGNVYGPSCNQVCLNASYRKNTCILENDQINVKSVNNKWKRSDAKIVTFDCDRGLSDSSNGATSPAADAYYYAQIFYKVFNEWGRLERTNREPHTLYVHFGENYPNSFWDGVSTTFGDGNEQTYPYATAEVIGHEMSHAITDSFGNLVFDKESEAVNEAFADICGKAISYYLKDDEAGWDFAYALLKKDKDENGQTVDEALRYFDDPTRDKKSIASLKDYKEYIDAYESMGIYLKAFYSIVVNQGVRFRDAFEAFVFANQIYWNEETTFVDGACGVVRAAADLGLDTEAFTNGFKQVDIKLKKTTCSLKGTEDHIVFCEKSADGEIRYAEVSSLRTARYTVRKAAGKQTIRITVSGNGDEDIRVDCSFGDGTGVVSNDRISEFPLNKNVDITVHGDTKELSEIKLLFEFL